MYICDYLEEARDFVNHKEYKEIPYSKRNWGNSWHSLTSYRGKLKPSIAHMLVKEFTSNGDIVLDPMCGVGTIPFEANLQGRIGVGNDLSKLAYVVTRAKLNPPKLDDALSELAHLDRYIELIKNEFSDNSEVKKFGLNRPIAEYYHPETLKEILAARKYFMDNRMDNSRALVMSCILHILHGNRPYALSRHSHPLTPYAPTGDYVYKNLIEHTRNKIDLMYGRKDFHDWRAGSALNLDALNIESVLSANSVDEIITSPPFSSSFRFYTQNWLRLWFSGWTESEFGSAKNTYFDDKQNKNMDIYIPFFKVCHEVLKPNGKMILHLGKSTRTDMSKELTKRCNNYFNVIYTGAESITNAENFGIRDVGATTEHQFLFLQNKS
mgnify:FL=1